MFANFKVRFSELGYEGRTNFSNYFERTSANPYQIGVVTASVEKQGCRQHVLELYFDYHYHYSTWILTFSSTIEVVVFLDNHEDHTHLYIKNITKLYEIENVFRIRYYNKWGKVFKNRPSKNCGRQLLKIFT